MILARCRQSYPLYGAPPIVLNPKHLHHLVAEVIDDLDRDAAASRPLERTRRVGIERRPGVLVDLGAQCGLQRLVRVVGAKEIGVADKEAR
jgi:hypothetical protein